MARILFSFAKKAFFSLLPALILFLGAEGGLRLANFKYSNTVLEMRTIRNNPQGVLEGVIRHSNHGGVVHMIKDARQHWVPKHSPLENYTIEKPAGTLRIAALGCSCTAGCDGSTLSYPGILETILRRDNSRVEVLNAAVGSYSSFQGLQRLKYAVVPYHPDIVTIYFGWNDHWVTSTTDKNIRVYSDSEIRLLNFFENFRVFQALNYLITTLRNRKPPQSAKDTVLNLRLRVSAREYSDNLNEMIKIARENKIRPILITAPQEIGDWPARNQVFPFPKHLLLLTHESYNNAVRQVARATNTELIDLAKEAALEPPGSVLSTDGIHFHEKGCAWVAGRLARYLESHPAAPFDAGNSAVKNR